MDDALHYIQISDERSLGSPLRRRCVASVKAALRPGDTYEMVMLPSGPNPCELARAADRIRILKARIVPRLVYIDTDCFLLRPFLPPADGRPYFGTYCLTETDLEMADIYYFFVNDAPEYFRDNFPEDLHAGGFVSVDPDILRGLKDFGKIPDESFLHCYSTLRSGQALAALQELSFHFARLSEKLGGM